MSQEYLKLMFQTLSNAAKVLILPHNNPDPDAIASAVALRYLLAERLNIEGYIVYKGIIGRAENKALVNYLGYPLQPLVGFDLDLSMPVALIDTQPGAGNNPVPPETPVAVVIDHHTWPETVRTAEVAFADIRFESGATSTILTEYLQAANIQLPKTVATALFYGIKTNTMGLGRNASPADVAAYYYLQPRLDIEALAKIENARVSSTYFKSFDKTLRAARIYNGVVISFLGIMSYPDMTAEMADLLLRLEGSQWVVCMGVYEDMMILSVRTRRRQHNAEQLVQTIVRPEGTAGGHGTIAGGQIPLAGQDPEAVVSELTSRALQSLNVAPGTAGSPLI